MFRKNPAEAKQNRKSIFNRDERDAIAESPYWENDQGVVFNREGVREIGLRLHLPPMTALGKKEKLDMWDLLRGVLHNGIPEDQRGRMIIAGMRATPDTIQTQPGNGHPLARELRASAARQFEQMRLRNEVLRWEYYFTCTVPGRVLDETTGYTEGQYERIMENAFLLRTRLQQMFGHAGISAEELDEQDVFNIMYHYRNPDFQSVTAPRFIPSDKRRYYLQSDLEEYQDIYTHSLREQLNATDIDNTRLDYLKVGTTFVSVTTMRNVPDTTYINGVTKIINALNKHGVHRAYLFADYYHEKFQQQLSKVRNRARQFNSTVKDTDAGYIDPETRAGLADTEDFLTYLSRSNQHIFSTAVGLMLMEDTPEQLRAATEAARSGLGQLGGGSPVTSQAQNIKQFMLEFAPFAGGSPASKFKVLEENSADFYPLTGPWEGTFKHENDPVDATLFLNRANTVTRYNLFSQYSNNYCSVIIAGSGSGKTFLANYFITDMIAQEGIVTIIDRGNGYNTLVKLLDGHTVVIGPGSMHTINPFDLPKGHTSPEDRKVLYILALLRSMVPPDGTGNENVENQLLKEAISRTYSRTTEMLAVTDPAGQHVLDEDGNRTYAAHFRGATMTDFVQTLRNLTELEGEVLDMKRMDLVRSLTLQFREWTGDGMYGRFVDGETTIDITHPIMCFEIGELEKSGPLGTVGMMLISELAWQRAYLYKNRPKLTVFDEAWKLLRNQQAREVFEEFFRRGRHIMLGPLAITQSIDDFDTLPGVLVSTSNFFLGNLPGQAAKVRERLGLNDDAMATFESIGNQTASTGTPQNYKEFFAWNRMGNSEHGDIIRVYTSSLQRWTYSTNQIHDAKRAAAIAAAGGDTLAGLRALAGN